MGNEGRKLKGEVDLSVFMISRFREFAVWLWQGRKGRLEWSLDSREERYFVGEFRPLSILALRYFAALIVGICWSFRKRIQYSFELFRGRRVILFNVWKIRCCQVSRV